jgi:hypothetical protein
MIHRRGVSGVPHRPYPALVGHTVGDLTLADATRTMTLCRLNAVTVRGQSRAPIRSGTARVRALVGLNFS